MQQMTYEGYLENGQFIPDVPTVSFDKRLRVMLTVLDEPKAAVRRDPKEIREWLNELDSIKNTMTVELTVEDFPRFNFGRDLAMFDDE